MRLRRAVLLGLIAFAAVRAQPANPDIHRAMQQFVDDGAVAGAVTLVERAGEIVSLGTAGLADLATRAPMRPDTLFSIASMSKPVAATAILMLQDAGQLSIDDPIEKFLPEFRGQMVVAEKTPERVVLTPPRQPVTLRTLLSHTSGLNTDLPDEGIGLTQERKARFYASQPLSFEPGSRWQYSNPGINVLARVVEVVAHESYEAFLQTRLFDPLGMSDTTFWPSEAQARRLATLYTPGEDGRGLRPVKIPYLGVLSLTSRERPPLPAGGLFSTAPDLRKFYGMLLRGGVAEGRRHLSATALAMMTEVQTAGLKVGAYDGAAWGLGLSLVREPRAATAMLSAGTFGHGGAYGTQVWADPHTQTLYLLLIQRWKPRAAEAALIRTRFLEIAAGAVGAIPR